MNRVAPDRTRGEMMSKRTDPSKASSTGRGLDVTFDLVRRAESKLIGLHANRSQLRRRIRALHYLLKTLNIEGASLDLPLPVSQTARESGVDHDKGAEVEKSWATALPSSIGNKESLTENSAALGISTELRRACRIALLESDRPQSCEQILYRIQRRKSVCVEGLDDAVNAIEQGLRQMLADGEVVHKKDHQLWQLNRDSCAITQDKNPHK